MAKFQPLALVKKPAFILSLICLVFFLKGVFLAAVIPILKGQDEARHYITIQYLANPGEKGGSSIIKEDIAEDGFEKYVGSEEFEKMVRAASLSDFQGHPYSKPTFKDDYNGENELVILNNRWDRIVDPRSGSIIGGEKLYHRLASLIERALQSQTILTRFFAIRIFSVLLGVITVLLSYLLIKCTGFSAKNSLILTALIAFQPKFAAYTTNINYDALLIPIFVLFALGGVLFLKHGPNWKNISLLAASFILGIFTKGTAIIFVSPLLFLLYKKIKSGGTTRGKIASAAMIVLVIAIILFLQYGRQTFLPAADGKLTPTSFLLKNFERMSYSSSQYWGSLDWTTNNFSDIFLKVIWIIEAITVVGVIYFLLSKRKLDFLPEKKYVVFLIVMLFSLQAGILFNNWKITSSGAEKLIASPGRYFIPNIAAHIIVMFTGIGALLRKKILFRAAAIFGIILMFTFSFYLIFNIIIPRYYF